MRRETGRQEREDRETGDRQGVWRHAGRRETGRRETGRQNHWETEDVVSSVAKPETVLKVWLRLKLHLKGTVS